MFAYRAELFRETSSFLLAQLHSLPLHSPSYQYVERSIMMYLEELSEAIIKVQKDHDEQAMEYLLEGGKRFANRCMTHVGMMRIANEITADQDDAFGAHMKLFFEEQALLIQKRKKIVVLTASFGFGHNSAANALKNTLEELYSFDVDICIIDILKNQNSLYENSVKYTPGVYRWIFESTDTNQGTEVINALAQPVLSVRIDQILREENPDMIVSTYPFLGAMRWVESKLQKNGKHIPLVAVVTDSMTVHQMWIMEHVDFYMVPNADTAKVLVQKGVPEDRIKVSGFPVNPAFYLPYDVTKERIREGLDPTIFTFLVLVNTGGKAKDVDFLERFEEVFQGKAQCMLVLGKNIQLYKKLKKKKFGPNIKIYQWVKDMPRLMHAADVMVAKAGGAITMECIAIKKPILITKILPGQEEGNAETVEKYDVGSVLRTGSAEELLSEMKRYIDEPTLHGARVKNFEALTIKKATYLGAEFLRGLL